MYSRKVFLIISVIPLLLASCADGTPYSDPFGLELSSSAKGKPIVADFIIENDSHIEYKIKDAEKDQWIPLPLSALEEREEFQFKAKGETTEKSFLTMRLHTDKIDATNIDNTTYSDASAFTIRITKGTDSPLNRDITPLNWYIVSDLDNKTKALQCKKTKDAKNVIIYTFIGPKGLVVGGKKSNKK